jgi:hypothetical protein
MDAALQQLTLKQSCLLCHLLQLHADVFHRRTGGDTQPSLRQPKRAASLTPLLGVDDFVGCQNMFLRMNHQVDAGEWPLFDKNVFAVWAGIPLSALIRLSLPQPRRAASLTPSLRVLGNFVGCQNLLVRMNCQVDAAEWPPFFQKMLAVWAGCSFSMWTRPSLP